MIKLGKWEIEIIEHRETENICECLFDRMDDEEPSLLESEIGDNAGAFVDALKQRLIELRLLDFAAMTPVEQEVIIDIIDGSTTASCLIETGSADRLEDRVFDGMLNEYKAIRSAGRRLAKECGCDFPE